MNWTWVHLVRSDLFTKKLHKHNTSSPTKPTIKLFNLISIEKCLNLVIIAQSDVIRALYWNIVSTSTEVTLFRLRIIGCWKSHIFISAHKCIVASPLSANTLSISWRDMQLRADDIQVMTLNWIAFVLYFYIYVLSGLVTLHRQEPSFYILTHVLRKSVFRWSYSSSDALLVGWSKVAPQQFVPFASLHICTVQLQASDINWR